MSLRKRFANFRRKRKEKKGLKKGYHVRRSVFTNDPQSNQAIRCVDNSISTTRYNPITFLPKNLYEQMHRISNVFFVFVAVLTVTPISPTLPYPSIIALTVVLTFQAAKDAWEDYQRFLTDRSINARTAIRLTPSPSPSLSPSPLPSSPDSYSSLSRSSSRLSSSSASSDHMASDSLCPFEEIVRWDALQVGDIVCVRNDQEIPADLLLLSTSRDDGQCFVETANLDGESNLKLRWGHAQTTPYRTPEELMSLRIEVDADEPNSRMYEFDGSIVLRDDVDDNEYPLTIDNFLHRGIVLRHTDHVYGLVIYTGHQTKYMMSTNVPRHKRTKLEEQINTFMKILLAFLAILCVVGAIITTVVYQYGVTKNHYYIVFTSESGIVLDTFKSILTNIVVFAQFIPLTIYVKIEVTRFMQARIMERDVRMYSLHNDTQVKVRASNLMEELGQIDYIFSDKTGTLTKNEMILRAVSVDGVTYGTTPDFRSQERFDEDEYLRSFECHDVELRDVDGTLMNDTILDENLDVTLRTAKGGPLTGAGNVSSMFFSLAICNAVIPSHMNGRIVYQSASPDETALVIGAKRAGFELKSRNGDECVLSVFGEDVTIEILAVNEFTSDRRRSSVIVRMPDGSIRILMKGADEAMIPLCRDAHDQGTIDSLQAAEDFSAKGLRTLIFAQRTIPIDEFDEWAERHWNTARLATENRKQLLFEAAAVIERDVDMIGTTAIEDLLQDDVAGTISDLMRANIKLWVLTGDKAQTAINIAETCSLITPRHHVIRIKIEQKSDMDNIVSQLEEAESVAKGRECALVIDGRAIEYILDNGHADKFVAVGKLCNAVVCCRSTPIQKQQTIELMKSRIPIRTLAIGDGANDVPMIQAAHVGVSVKGNEGMQAVLSSDFVLGQFRFLKRLLLLHGRTFYRRNGFVVCYEIYKDVVSAMIPLWFSFFCMWSEEIYLDPWLRVLYNIIFTAAPIVMYSLHEQDLPSDVILRYPQLYTAGQRNESLNLQRFGIWMCIAFWDSVVCFFGAIHTPFGQSEAITSSGHTGDYRSTATLTYTVMVLVVNLHLFLHTHNWTLPIIIAYSLTISAWFVISLIYCTKLCVFLASPYMYMIIEKLYAAPMFYLFVTVLTWLAIFPDIVFHSYLRNFLPRMHQILQEKCKSREWEMKYPQRGNWVCGEDDSCFCCLKVFCCMGLCKRKRRESEKEWSERVGYESSHSEKLIP